MTSLAAFAPVAPALKARKPTSASRRVSAAVRAEAPEGRDSASVPVINTRRALLGGAVGAAMSFALTPGRADAKDGKNGVYWISPKDGATVDKSFTVRMGVKGYEVAPAAEGLQEGTGHHHIVVDDPKGYVEKGEAIPFDATHLHYGKAQKEATIELEPGTHTLTLQFANANHASFGKKFAKTITVTVAE
jgi:hypothetical protein